MKVWWLQVSRCLLAVQVAVRLFVAGGRTLQRRVRCLPVWVQFGSSRTHIYRYCKVQAHASAADEYKRKQPSKQAQASKQANKQTSKRASKRKPASRQTSKQAG